MIPLSAATSQVLQGAIQAVDAVNSAQKFTQSVTGSRPVINITGNSSVSATNFTTNPNYVLWLRDPTNSQLQVVTDAPRNFNWNLRNNWTTFLSELRSSLGGGGQSKIGDLLAAYQKFSGNYVLPKILTALIWQGSEPLDFQLPLVFNAKADAKNDVVKPLRNLIRMAAPSRSGIANGVMSVISDVAGAVSPTSAAESSAAKVIASNLWSNISLHPPGPTLQDLVSGASVNSLPRALTLDIGRSISIPGLVITDMSVEWENRFTKEGFPISVQVNLQLRAFYTWDRDDYLKSMFNLGD